MDVSNVCDAINSTPTLLVVAVELPSFDAMPNTPTLVEVELTILRLKVDDACVTENVFLDADPSAPTAL